MSLELRGIHHDFGGDPVLKGVHFSVNAGDVHALLGMNGAGKSTLLHITAGVITPKAGEIVIDGELVTFKSPADAVAHGIVFLTQEVDRGLVPLMSVHENLMVGLWKHEKSVLFRKKHNIARAKALLVEYGLEIDVEKSVGLLSLYEKQMLSIIRAVSNNAKYLLLDEPTASFDRKEAERFYETIQQVRQRGIGIIFISHKLHEVFVISQQITVLRAGAVVLEQLSTEVTMGQTIEAMTGGETAVVRRDKGHSTTRESSFIVPNLQLYPGSSPLWIDVKRGEIVGVFGLLGSGKTRLAQTLFGAKAPYEAIIQGSKRKIKNTTQAVAHGIAFIPEERGKHGVWKQEDIQTHLALSLRGWISKTKEKRYSTELIQQFKIQPNSPTQQVGRLSGGNQQKVAIAKWFAADRDVAIFDEPMKGIDVAAKEAIFQMIESLADKGASVLYFTAEPDEALRISDRILILRGGEFIQQGKASEMTLAELLLAAGKEVDTVGTRVR